MMKLTNEEDLLLALLKPEGPGLKKEIPAIIGRGIDWDGFYDILQNQSALSPLYAEMPKLNGLNINSEFSSRLRSYVYRNIAINAFLEKDLILILRHLTDSRIEAIPLKGPVLDRLLYGGTASRPASCDLDLLVRYKDLDRAVNSMRGLGYYYNKGTANEEFHEIYTDQIGLSSKNTFLKANYIELHCRLFDVYEMPTDFETEYFFKNTQFMSLGDIKILCPSYENLLIYLSLHIIGTKSFQNLRYFYDIHRLIAGYYKKIDWQRLSATLKRFALNAAFFASVNISRDFFGTELPQSFIESSSPGFIKKKVSKLLIRKGDIIRPTQHTRPFLYRYIFIKEFLLSSGIFDFIKRLSKIVFISPEEYRLRRDLPASWKIPFLCILRLFNPALALLGIKKRF